MKYYILNAFLVVIICLTSCSNEKSQATTDQSMVTASVDSASIDDTSVDSTSIKTGVSITFDSLTKIEPKAAVIQEVPQKGMESRDYAIVKGVLKQISIPEMGPTHVYLDVNGLEEFEGLPYSGYEITGKAYAEAMIDQEVVLKYLYMGYNEEADLHVDNVSIREYDQLTTEQAENQGLLKIEGVISWSMHENGVSGDFRMSRYDIIQADGSVVEVKGWVYEDIFSELNGKQVTAYVYPTYNLYTEEIKNVLKKKPTQTELEFVKEKVDTINSKMDAEAYTAIACEVDGTKGKVAHFKRSMDGDQLRFISVAYCTDLGCDKTSYYFWDYQLIFELIENEHSVGNTDSIYEKRNYYYDLAQIKSMEREMSGTEGYEEVKKQLTDMEYAVLTPGQPFNLDNIVTLFDLTVKRAQKDTYIFFRKPR